MHIRVQSNTLFLQISSHIHVSKTLDAFWKTNTHGEGELDNQHDTCILDRYILKYRCIEMKVSEKLVCILDKCESQLDMVYLK